MSDYTVDVGVRIKPPANSDALLGVMDEHTHVEVRQPDGQGYVRLCLERVAAPDAHTAMSDALADLLARITNAGVVAPDVIEVNVRPYVEAPWWAAR